MPEVCRKTKRRAEKTAIALSQEFSSKQARLTLRLGHEHADTLTQSYYTITRIAPLRCGVLTLLNVLPVRMCLLLRTVCTN